MFLPLFVCVRVLHNVSCRVSFSFPPCTTWSLHWNHHRKKCCSCVLLDDCHRLLRGVVCILLHVHVLWRSALFLCVCVYLCRWERRGGSCFDKRSMVMTMKRHFFLPLEDQRSRSSSVLRQRRVADKTSRHIFGQDVGNLPTGKASLSSQRRITNQ